MPKDKKRSFGPTPNHPPRRLHRYPALLSRLAQWSSLISESFHSDLRALAIAALSSSILLLGIRHLGWLQPLELSAYDQIIRLRSPDPPRSAHSNCHHYRTRHSSLQPLAPLRRTYCPASPKTPSHATPRHWLRPLSRCALRTRP